MAASLVLRAASLGGALGGPEQAKRRQHRGQRRPGRPRSETLWGKQRERARLPPAPRCQSRGRPHADWAAPPPAAPPPATRSAPPGAGPAVTALRGGREQRGRQRIPPPAPSPLRAPRAPGAPAAPLAVRRRPARAARPQRARPPPAASPEPPAAWAGRAGAGGRSALLGDTSAAAWRGLSRGSQ